MEQSIEPYHMALGGGRYVTVSRYNDALYVHIRQYEMDPITKKEYPTPKGIYLTPSRFANLMLQIEEIDRAVEQLKNKDDHFSEMKTHLGGGTYLTVQNGYQCVNIRRYFLPEGKEVPLPTHSGIALRIPEWDVFRSLLNDIKNCTPELSVAIPCFSTLGHDHPLLCHECSPFGWNYNSIF